MSCHDDSWTVLTKGYSVYKFIVIRFCYCFNANFTFARCYIFCDDVVEVHGNMFGEMLNSTPVMSENQTFELLAAENSKCELRSIIVIPMDTTVRLGPLKFSLQATIDHHGPSIHSGHYTASINCCKKKHSIATITQLRSLELLTKTHLLHMLYHMNWLTHDFWTRTGGWEFDRSHGAGTSSPSHWQQVEEQAPKPVGWTMCFLLMTLVPVQKLCVNNIYICCAFLIWVLL